MHTCSKCGSKFYFKAAYNEHMSDKHPKPSLADRAAVNIRQGLYPTFVSDCTLHTGSNSNYLF